MPIYEYQCQACGHVLEALQKLSDEPLKDCPECNKPDLQKLVSAAGFLYKGGSNKNGANSGSFSPGPGSCCGGGSCKH